MGDITISERNDATLLFQALTNARRHTHDAAEKMIYEFSVICAMSQAQYNDHARPDNY